MDEIKGDKVVAENTEAKIVGHARIVGGKIDNAVRLSGNKDYIDLGNYEDSCLGDISRCIYGFYISMWVSFSRLDDDTYFLATGPKGIKIYYKSQRLYGEAVSGNKHWEVYIYGLRGLDTRVWHFLEVSWNEDVGLVMYLNMKSVAFRNENAFANVTDTVFRNWYIGRANSGMSSEKYAAATFDDIQVFYADRITLLRLGFIQRGKSF